MYVFKRVVLFEQYICTILTPKALEIYASENDAPLVYVCCIYFLTPLPNASIDANGVDPDQT